MVVARGWQGGGDGELVFDGYTTASVLQDEQLWRWVVVMAVQQNECTNIT